MAYFLCVMGLVLVFEGLPYIISPDLVRKMARQMQELPAHQLRILGLIMAIAGLGVIWLGRHLGG